MKNQSQTFKQQCIFCHAEVEAESQDELAQKMFTHQFMHSPRVVEVLA
jgi:hypothetical protein